MNIERKSVKAWLEKLGGAQKEGGKHMEGGVALAGASGVLKCLAKAYLKQYSNNPAVEDIAHMRAHDDYAELATVFGEERVMLGRVVEINFSISKILLDECYKAESV